MQEQAILKGIKENNIDAYEALIDGYSSYLARVVMKVANKQLEPEEIEELCADVFIKLWQSREKLQLQEGKLKAYLATMARNKTINKLRAKGKLEIIPLEEDLTDYKTPESQLIEKENEALISEVLRTLPQEEREIFIRRYFYMEKVIHIASSLGVNVQTVSNKLFRGKKKLEKALKERGVAYE